MIRLVLVTDRREARGPLPDVVAAALEPFAPGSVAVMLREKDLEGRELIALASALREVTRAAGAALWINGRFDVALAVSADGVHLGGDAPSFADVRARAPTTLAIGVSLHGDESPPPGASWAIFAPVFPTRSKPDARPAGLGGLRAAVKRASGVPVYALGGIDHTRIVGCLDAGAAGVALRGGILGADDPRAAAYLSAHELSRRS